jgi:xanthine/uracil permease
MTRRLYVSAICAGLFTLFYLVWLGRLSRPMPSLLGWFFEAILVVSMAFGMNSHSPSYGYLIPVTFILAFLLFLATALLVSLLRSVRQKMNLG